MASSTPTATSGSPPPPCERLSSTAPAATGCRAHDLPDARRAGSFGHHGRRPGNVYFTSSATGSLVRVPWCRDIGIGSRRLSRFRQVVGSIHPSHAGLATGMRSASDIWVTSGGGWVARVTSSSISDANHLNGFATHHHLTGHLVTGRAVTHNNNVFVSSGEPTTTSRTSRGVGLLMSFVEDREWLCRCQESDRNLHRW